IEVKIHGDSFHMNRLDGTWVMTNRNKHPVRKVKVDKALIQLSQLNLYEPKTKTKRWYPRIDVEDVPTENSDSRHLRLADASGQTIAKVILGKDQYFMAGAAKRGVYLRKPGDDQAWLASGMLEVGRFARDWVERDIMDVNAKRVRSVETVANDNARLVVSRKKYGDRNLNIENMPEGTKLVSRAFGDMRDMASGLAAIDLNDVLPSERAAFSGDKASKAVIRTFDGLVVEVLLWQKDEDYWAQFKASVDPSSFVSNGEAQAKETKGAEKDEKADKGRLRGADEVKKEAQAINARVEGWAYEVPYYKGKPLHTRIDDLVVKKKGDKSS
ncbi:MAG: DUF4340 domain-containing protein, partial [Rhodospirillales bacterium]|nr:DUF4340 domain-containing protein [Rhodospirillales bacterium]